MKQGGSLEPLKFMTKVENLGYFSGYYDSMRTVNSNENKLVTLNAGHLGAYRVNNKLRMFDWVNEIGVIWRPLQSQETQGPAPMLRSKEPSWAWEVSARYFTHTWVTQSWSFVTAYNQWYSPPNTCVRNTTE